MCIGVCVGHWCIGSVVVVVVFIDGAAASDRTIFVVVAVAEAADIETVVFLVVAFDLALVVVLVDGMG